MVAALGWEAFVPTASAALAICVTLFMLAGRIGALIAEAKHDVQDLRLDVTEVKTDIRDMRPKLEAIVALQTQNQAVEKQICDILQRIQRLEAKA